MSQFEPVTLIVSDEGCVTASHIRNGNVNYFKLHAEPCQNREEINWIESQISINNFNFTYRWQVPSDFVELNEQKVSKTLAVRVQTVYLSIGQEGRRDYFQKMGLSQFEVRSHNTELSRFLDAYILGYAATVTLLYWWLERPTPELWEPIEIEMPVQKFDLKVIDRGMLFYILFYIKTMMGLTQEATLYHLYQIVECFIEVWSPYVIDKVKYETNIAIFTSLVGLSRHWFRQSDVIKSRLLDQQQLLDFFEDKLQAYFKQVEEKSSATLASFQENINKSTIQSEKASASHLVTIAYVSSRSMKSFIDLVNRNIHSLNEEVDRYNASLATNYQALIESIRNDFSLRDEKLLQSVQSLEKQVASYNETILQSIEESTQRREKLDELQSQVEQEQRRLDERQVEIMAQLEDTVNEQTFIAQKAHNTELLNRITDLESEVDQLRGTVNGLIQYITQDRG